MGEDVIAVQGMGEDVIAVCVGHGGGCDCRVCFVTAFNRP